MALLKALASRQEPVGVNELARSIGLSPATTYRLLNSLAAEGFAEQDPATAKYQVGSEVIPLALSYLDRRHLGHDCIPVMQELAAQSGESVNLGVLSGTFVYYVQQVEGPNPLRFGRDIGIAVPLYCSALGKLLLAHMPEEPRRALVDRLRLDWRTPKTITERSKLLAALETVAEQGYSLDLGENIENLIGMAVPVRDIRGSVVAGLSLMGPSMRLTSASRTRLLPKLRSAGDALSRRLGWQPA